MLRFRKLLLMIALAVAGRFLLSAPAWSDDPPTVETAWKYLRMGRWFDAEKLLKDLTGSSDRATAAQARFAAANLWQHRRPTPDDTQARAIYESIVTDFPESHVAPWAMLALARMLDIDVLRPDPKAAAEAYRVLMERYPDSDAAHEAAMHRALAVVAVGGHEADARRQRSARGSAEEKSQAVREADELLLAAARAARTELENWNRDHPSSVYVPAINSVLASISRYPLADYRAAVGYWRIALKAGPATTGGRRGMTWALATVADRELGDRETAVEFYTKYLQEFPTDANAYRCKEALRRLGAPLPPLEDMSIEAVTRRARP
jgi:tetratricopeptide (TPR) repeat protein